MNNAILQCLTTSEPSWVNAQECQTEGHGLKFNSLTFIDIPILNLGIYEEMTQYLPIEKFNKKKIEMAIIFPMLKFMQDLILISNTAKKEHNE